MPELTFNTHGNLKQKECAKAWTDDICTEIVYGGSKGSAKSFTGVSLVFGDAFIYPETKYFIARKALNDLVKYTIPSIKEVFGIWGIKETQYKFNGTYNFFTLENGSTVQLLEAKRLPGDPLYERFGSMQMTKGWIEEAGEFEESAKNNLGASCGRWKNAEYGLSAKLLQTCNPSKNYLYREFYKKYKAGTLERWKRFIQALPTDNKMLQPGYLEHLERILTKNERERLLKGNWEFDDNPDAIMDYEKILDIFDGNKRLVKSGKKCITSDLARLGGDKIIVVEWDGFRGFVQSFKKKKLDFTTLEIEKSRSKLNCGKKDVLADESGLGSGVVDLMGYQGFNAKHSPLPSPEAKMNDKGKKEPENYDMMRSQTGFRFAERVNNNGVYLECANKDDMTLIIEELEQVKKLPIGPNLKRCLISKDEMKEALGRSCDFWDGLHIREKFELKPQTNYSQLQTFNVPINMDSILSLSNEMRDFRL